MKNSVPVGKILKKIREDNGWTLEKMAQKLGTTKQALSRYERDERSPKLPAAAHFAEVLGITLEQLAGIDPLPGAYTAPRDFLTMFGEPSEDEQQLLSVYRQLNASGRDKLMDYARDLSENERYTKDTQSKAT